jgi:TonB family protein
MLKSYFPHFGTMIFLHALLLMVSWELSQRESFRQEVQRLGQGVMSLQLSSPHLPRALKKYVSPKAPLKAAAASSTLSQSTMPSSDLSTRPQSTSSNKEGSDFGTSTVGKTDVRSLYKAELRGIIDQNKYYPPISKRLGHEGTVVVSFTLLEDGSIIDLRIESPSRYRPLNASALEAVKKVKRFRPIPKEMGDSKMELSIPVSFKLI